MVAGVARRGAARCGSARRDATRRNSRSLSASLSACIRISGWWRQERWKGQRQQLSVAVDGNGAGWRSALGESRAYLLEGSATTNSVYCCWCCRWCCWWCCCWPYACWSVVSVVFSSVHSVVGLASSPEWHGRSAARRFVESPLGYAREWSLVWSPLFLVQRGNPSVSRPSCLFLLPCCAAS